MKLFHRQKLDMADSSKTRAAQSVLAVWWNHFLCLLCNAANIYLIGSQQWIAGGENQYSSIQSIQSWKPVLLLLSWLFKICLAKDNAAIMCTYWVPIRYLRWPEFRDKNCGHAQPRSDISWWRFMQSWRIGLSTVFWVTLSKQPWGSGNAPSSDVYSQSALHLQGPSVWCPGYSCACLICVLTGGGSLCDKVVVL